jgi:hypothetical protein
MKTHLQHSLSTSPSVTQRHVHQVELLITASLYACMPVNIARVHCTHHDLRVTLVGYFMCIDRGRVGRTEHWQHLPSSYPHAVVDTGQLLIHNILTNRCNTKLSQSGGVLLRKRAQVEWQTADGPRQTSRAHRRPRVHVHICIYINIYMIP